MTGKGPLKQSASRGRKLVAVQGRTGFTLIEMTVVLAIISILTTIGLFSYASLRSNQEARSAEQKITAILAAARQNAITTNGRFQVFFHLPTGEMWIDELDTAGAVSRRQVYNPGWLPDFVRIESIEIEGVAQTGDSAAIRYWPDGHSESAEICLARVNDDSRGDKRTTTIKVFGPTGTARASYDEPR